MSACGYTGAPSAAAALGWCAEAAGMETRGEVSASVRGGGGSPPPMEERWW